MGFRIQVGHSTKCYFFFFFAIYISISSFLSVISVLWKMSANLCITLYMESLQVFQNYCN